MKGNLVIVISRQGWAIENPNPIRVLKTNSKPVINPISVNLYLSH